MVVWHGSNGVGCINEVTEYQVWLVPGWVTTFWLANHFGTQANSVSYPEQDGK